MICPAPLGYDLTEEEVYIRKPDASTCASPNLAAFNPLPLSSTPTSSLLADSCTHELTIYGEYSEGTPGKPTSTPTLSSTSSPVALPVPMARPSSSVLVSPLHQRRRHLLLSVVAVPTTGASRPCVSLERPAVCLHLDLEARSQLLARRHIDSAGVRDSGEDHRVRLTVSSVSLTLGELLCIRDILSQSVHYVQQSFPVKLWPHGPQRHVTSRIRFHHAYPPHLPFPHPSTTLRRDRPCPPHPSLNDSRSSNDSARSSRHHRRQLQRCATSSPWRRTLRCHQVIPLHCVTSQRPNTLLTLSTTHARRCLPFSLSFGAGHCYSSMFKCSVAWDGQRLSPSSLTSPSVMLLCLPCSSPQYNALYYIVAISLYLLPSLTAFFLLWNISLDQPSTSVMTRRSGLVVNSCLRVLRKIQGMGALISVCYVDVNPDSYLADISNTNLPAELLPKYTTIEYTLSRPAQVPPIFLFVVDTCLDEEDLKALRDAIVVSLSLIPPYALVGLITYGTMTQVHEIGYPECSKSYVFRGGKDYQPKQIQEMLGLSSQNRAAPRPGQPLPQQAFGAARFLMPVSQCEFQLTSILETLTRDPWPVANDKRALRCTGVALTVAVGLLETAFPNIIPARSPC
ncbi:hypothetical protein NMY22_g19738 [Coprinellus aureogranulatus]|nr:hypothetical protein NMY22_g19738 [Coprinellus aureogranulatus]